MSDNIKLVIEIPKDIYARCKEYKLWSYDAEKLEGAVATSKPLSEVLRDIEQEVYDLKEKCTACEYLGCGIIEIIDKHIGRVE